MSSSETTPPAGVSMSDVPYVATTNTSENPRRLIYDKPKPCYCKVPDTLTGVVAISLSHFLERCTKLQLDDKINELHRLHLKLDAVVLRYSAVKFSGSAESYLVAKSGVSDSETAQVIHQLTQELLAVHHEDLKAVASLGQVGFALLGSTAWNYQFYGDIITEMKHRVEELNPGELVFDEVLLRLLDESKSGKEQEISSTVDDESNRFLLDELRQKAKQKVENQDCNLEPVSRTPGQFCYWWATRVQYTDIWVLFLTFTLSCLSIRRQLESGLESGLESYPWIFFFLQFQCCLVNVFVGYGWMINREWFLNHHNLIMSIVWCTQFLSRMVQSGFNAISNPQFQSMSILHQILATNGPEKLLLMTAPVNLWISGFLHLISASAAAGVVFKNCSPSSSSSSCPSECRPATLIPTLVCIFLFLMILPLVYSVRVEREAKMTFKESNNQSKKTSRVSNDSSSSSKSTATSSSS